jgi:riboflavin kinase/FMN adenylyltransferase
MELIRGLHNLRPRHRGCVATIGNYDGVHRGHQAVLAGLKDKACALDLPAVVVTFEPMPREYFAPAKAPARLTRFREKWTALAACGMDRLLCLRFNQALAGLPPEEFIRRVLLDGLAVRYLVVGDDFRFGRERAGDFALLQRAAARHGFELARTPTLTVGDLRVSSTRIRKALAAGDLDTARALLGRRFRMLGRVAYGDGLGRQLGFPTANIRLERGRSPVHGIFVVRVEGAGERPLDGVASVGTRPTVGGETSVLEVFILDFDGDLYGCHIEVEFLVRLRDELHFNSLDELKRHIRQDVEQAKAFIAQSKAK